MRSHTTAHRSTVGAWLRFGAALVVLGVVAAGIPVGLIIAARAGLGSSSPLPGIGTWDQIHSWATTERSSTELARVALRILISLCWLLWAALLASLLSSLVATRPRLGRVRLPRLAIFDGFGTWLIAGLTALSTLTPNIAHAQTVTPRLPAAVTTRATATAVTPTPVQTAIPTSPTRPGWAGVQAAESIEMFAARTLGDGQRWPEIFDLNQGRTMNDGTTFSQPWRLTAGWELELPTATAPDEAPTEETGTFVEPATQATTDRYRPVETITVADGDNLWDLSAARLRSVGHADDDATVARLVNDVVAVNPTMNDPSLIHRGQQLVMPAVGTPPPADTTGPTPAAADQAEQTHTIVHGSTLWDITRTTYERVDAPLVNALAAYNQLADPNNIPIGTVIRLPPIETLTAVPVSPRGDQPTTDGTLSAPAGPTVDDAAPAPAATPARTTAPVTPVTSPPLSAEVPAPTTTIPANAPNATAPQDGSASTPALLGVPPVMLDRPTSSPLPWAAAGTTSVGLATGLLELWRRRRRSRWARGGTPWSIGSASEPAPAELTEMADLGLLEWVAAALAHVAASSPPACVLSVEFGQNELAVRWDRPQPIADVPWVTNEGGSVWLLSRVDRLTPPEGAPLVGFPGLVTFGVRDGRQYLVNLSAFGTIAVDGPGADAFVGAVALELATNGLLSDAIVHLHGVDLIACEQLDRVEAGFDEPVDRSSPSMHVSIVESDDPVLDEHAAASSADESCRAILILGVSDRAVGAELHIEANGTAIQHPGDVAFIGSLVPGALKTLDTGEDLRCPAPVKSTDTYAVRDDRGLLVGLSAPRSVLRLFSNLLPDLDPGMPTVDARAMTVIAALDYLGAGRRPQQLAELLRVKVKTIQNKLGRLRELDLVRSDGNVWTLDTGVRSDADWARDLARHVRDASSRGVANRALNECWELFSRMTGPAYAHGGASSLWAWVDERDADFGGATAAEAATSTLLGAVQVAVETWDRLSTCATDDLITADRLVDLILRLESALRSVEPWTLFQAAAIVVTRTQSPATCHRVATRLAAIVQDSNLDPPDALVAQVLG